MSSSNYQYESVSNNGNESDPIKQREQPTTNKTLLYALSGIILLLSGYIAHDSVATKSTTPPSGAPVDYAPVKATIDFDSNGDVKLFDKHDRFVMEDFDSKPTFSDFLPGVAGLYGKPVWSFYVNRGQGIASFGTDSKEYPILEFNAANKAYQLTPFIGFRTFIKGNREGKEFMTEPFSPGKARIPGKEGEESKPKRFLYVGTNEMAVREFDLENEFETYVQYMVLPDENFASLMRRARFTNTGKTAVTFQILDGLAKIEPDGGKLDFMLKFMGRTLEGWMGVYHASDDLTMPYYRMSTEPSDSASVKIEEGGHFCMSFIENKEEAPTLLPIVFDPTSVFGWDTSLETPAGFEISSVKEILAGKQYGDAKTSSAFAAVESLTLQPGESATISSFYGKVEHIDKVEKIRKVITQPGYVAKKFQHGRDMIDELLSGVETKTANHLFNGAVKQTFLDNSLRGGLPIALGDINEEMAGNNADEDDRVKIFHAFSRIHGDLERDYNAFSIDPTFFSQGPGNFRDVAQNRRNDVFFVPKMASFDVQMFLGYIQADGYEPLTVEGVAYLISDRDVAEKLASETTADSKSASVLTDIMTGGPFRPGQLFELVDQLDVNLKVDNDIFINTILAAANQTAMGVYGTGYWADHWDYYIDLIEAYLAIYPDGEEALMFDKELRYFFSTATCKPRSEKYVLTYTFDGQSKHVLQLDATYYDDAKVQEQKSYLDASTGRIGIDANWQRTPEGEAFKSSPIAKLLLLGSIKYATRDSYGMGVEYEGGRPGWNDAMNGLVGMVGSGMPETYELFVLLRYVLKVVEKYQRSVIIPSELAVMISSVNEALTVLDSSDFTEPENLSMDVPEVLFTYWDTVTTARETYRESVKMNFSGETTELTATHVIDTVTRWLAEIQKGMDRAMQIGTLGDGDDGTTGVPPSYFSYDVTEWELNGGHNDEGLPLVNALAMTVGTFPQFLEGPVRNMKVIDQEEKKDIYDKVKVSGLRDEELKMYFLSASLKGQSYDMGRMMAFSPGWLENQSIWMHMSYKYYLELIRGGLYEQFFSELKEGGITVFMDPKVYGRSLMECSSFIASSAFPDSSQHGRGFLARLSGSTAEFLSMWVLMFIGPNPFFIGDDGSLQMQLIPALPMWLFVDENDTDTIAASADEEVTLSFKMFAAIDVTYHNSERKNLYGVAPDSYVITYKDGSTVSIEGSSVPTDVATDIRRVVTVQSIDAFF